MLMKSLLDRGYEMSVTYPNGKVAALQGIAICATFDSAGHRDYWRYADLGSALMGLMHWDGEGEPAGWVRHFPSCRRQDSKGIYYDKGELPKGVAAEQCKDKPWRFYVTLKN